MSRHTKPSKQTSQLIDRRLDLTLQFMQEVIADPSRLDEIPPSGSVVVILPADDPEFAAHERAHAERLTAEGRHVVVVTVGAEPISEEGWARLNAPLPAWHPIWASDLTREQATVVYDQSRDTLFVDLSHGQRQGWAWPRNDFAYLLIDEETEEAFGYLVPEFLAKAVPHNPSLAQALRIAELRPLHESERGQLAILSDWHLQQGEPGSLVQAANEARADLMTALDQLAGEPVAV